MIKNTVKLLTVILITSLLSGCPMPDSNFGSHADYTSAKSYHLPFPQQHNKAIYYLNSAYSFLDWDFVGGAASDGYPYSGSTIAIYKKNKLLYSGRLEAANPFTGLCFNLNPGRYTMRIQSKRQGVSGSVKPTVIQVPLLLSRNHVYYGLLDAHGVSAVTIKYRNIDASEGKFFIKRSPPKRCVSL